MNVSRAAVDVSGVLLLDKPAGISSNCALQRVRVLYGRPKGGHAGTLDPLATGLLPICLGEATKFTSALLGSEKSYETTLRLGYRSSTGDAEGRIEPVGSPNFSALQLDAAMKALTGRFEQLPPMHSAVKVQGRPLYRHAREGRIVERRTRTVEVRRLDLMERHSDLLHLFVTCSKGTYVRVLAEDLGAKLGCGAYVTALRRTAVGRFTIDGSVSLSGLEAMDPDRRRVLLLPIDSLLHGLPRLELSTEDGSRLLRGLPAAGLTEAAPGPVRLYAPDGRFLGVGEADGTGSVVPKRLLAVRAQARLSS